MIRLIALFFVWLSLLASVVMAMNKAELTETLASSAGIDQSTAALAVNYFFEGQTAWRIVNKNTSHVQTTGFGTFVVSSRPSTPQSSSKKKES